MRPEVLRVLERLENEDNADRQERESGVVKPPEEGMWALYPDTGRLLHILIQWSGYKNLAEVGVSHGYSTVWLADAARITGGRVTALENNPVVLEIAKKNLAEAGLTDWVDFVLGDCFETLPKLEKPTDLLLLDCWDRLYPSLFPLIAPAMRPGGLLAVDNISRDGEESRAFRRMCADSPDLVTVNVPIGRGGLEVGIRITGEDGSAQDRGPT